MQLTSRVFKEGGIIPSTYTCEGKNISPPLEISGVPKEARSLVLIMEDPDVPVSIRPDRMWDHWILFNLAPTLTKIEEDTTPPSIAGKTTFGSNRYGGPCPPDAEHRYFFKLYALDCKLDLKAGATKKEVEKAMKGHILTQCQLMGRYEKAKGY